MFSNKARWIWVDSTYDKNEYAYFTDKFTFDGGKALFTVAAETDYILYINGSQVAFDQFAGYPFEKYYDEIDITPFCKMGENTVELTVRYEGVNSSTHIDDGAGVIYSLAIDGETVLFSSSETFGGYDNRYVQHVERSITVQLGLTSCMRCGEAVADRRCVEVEKTYVFRPRPVKRCELLPFVEATEIKDGLYDIGRETVGYISLVIESEADATVTVSYGQHIADGCVRRKVGGRDFSVDFEVTKGCHEFTQYFIRISGRYLQIEAPEGVKIQRIGVVPVLYPLTEIPFTLENELDQKIYDTCVRTLRLCMHNHYEDTPWREQALYVLDAINDMRCGYYTFEGTDFQRANLVFMSKGVREDGLMELTYPAINTPAIPFFSVMYPVLVHEYVMNTGDKSILDEIMVMMLTLMNSIKSKIDDNGLIPDLPSPYWNFYEWTEGSNDVIPFNPGYKFGKNYHIVLSCAFVYSSRKFKELCEMVGFNFDFDEEAMKEAINRVFFNSENGLFRLRTDCDELYSQLGNAFALLIGLGDERTMEALKSGEGLVDISISMNRYKYDALLAADPANKEYILNDIREKYGYMLSEGATSFWETIKGESDFSDAGSLCHGWSALPAYYYHLFFGKKEG